MDKRTLEGISSNFMDPDLSLMRSKTFPFASFEGITVSIFKFSGTTKQRTSSSKNKLIVSLHKTKRDIRHF